MTQRLLTMKEAAYYLGIEYGRLRAWLGRGNYKIAYYILGHKLRFKQEDLDRFMKRNSYKKALKYSPIKT